MWKRKTWWLKALIKKIICTFWCWRKEWIVWAEHAHLHFLHHLFAEWADFGWDGDGHVLSAAVLTADPVERARPVLNATVIQIRLRNEQRNKLRAVSSIVHWKILTLTFVRWYHRSTKVYYITHEIYPTHPEFNQKESVLRAFLI